MKYISKLIRPTYHIIKSNNNVNAGFFKPSKNHYCHRQVKKRTRKKTLKNLNKKPRKNYLHYLFLFHFIYLFIRSIFYQQDSNKYMEKGNIQLTKI